MDTSRKRADPRARREGSRSVPEENGSRVCPDKKRIRAQKEIGFLETPMKKPLFEKQVRFRGSRVSEVDRKSQEEAMTSSLDLEARNRGGTRTSTMSHKHNFPFHKVPTQVPVKGTKGGLAATSEI